MRGMIRWCVVAAVVAVVAPVASGQAITGFTGGNQFAIYYGGSTGDVVGYRFTVSDPLEVTDLGVWNADSNTGGAGLSSAHQVGIWDGSQNLVASANPGPGGTVVGQWTYASITPVTLVPGQTYTIGTLYTGTDNDSYISSATSATTSAEVTWVQSVYPSAGSLGFVYPANNTTSFGRFGPNFMYNVVPVELQSFTIE